MISRRRSGSCVRCCLLLFAALFVSAPAFYFKFYRNLKVSASCAPCTCHCAPPLIPPGLANLSVSDCGKGDPDLKEEMEKNLVDLLSEELKLQQAVSIYHSQHMNISVREARSSASHYKKEAEKCNAAIEASEGARELAETLLSKEKKTTLLWERRAKLLGWEEQ